MLSAPYALKAERAAVADTLRWEIVTGTAQQAAPNSGYLANSPAQVTITLPVSSEMGEVVRVAGMGAGGWKIAQNDGQSIFTRNLGDLPGAVWIPHAGDVIWQSVASSADGIKLVAVPNPGRIYTSVPSTTPGSAGSLSGDADSAIELQYTGSGQWRILSHEGAITAQ
jgi:hypothetical protein